MRALATGVAGFIGSNLARELVASGWKVRGVGRYTSFYEEATKRANLADLARRDTFELMEAYVLTMTSDQFSRWEWPVSYGRNRSDKAL
jgi:nucleoside-diphosphate-sugar epimerase